MANWTLLLLSEKANAHNGQRGVHVHTATGVTLTLTQSLPLSKTIPNTPMEVLLDLGRDHVGFPKYSRDTPPQQDMR